jgi:hypothetical protein
MSTPIEFMETQELVHELKKRFDEMMFIGFNQKSKHSDSYHIAIKGTLHGAFGMIEVLTRAADAHVEDE